jgi:hypothetical protein
MPYSTNTAPTKIFNEFENIHGVDVADELGFGRVSI